LWGENEDWPATAGDNHGAVGAAVRLRVRRGYSGPDGDSRKARMPEVVPIGDLGAFLGEIAAEEDLAGYEDAVGGPGQNRIVPSGAERKGEAEGQE
jgi:hypothetical protein